MNLMSSVFYSFSSIANIFFFSFIIVGFLFLVFNRAYFVFFNKLWAIFHREEFYDSYLDSTRKNTLDVERFKVMFGMGRGQGIRTVRDTHQAIKWADSVAIPLRTLGRAGDWVNWPEQDVKNPGYFQRGVLCVFIALLCLFLAPASILSFGSESIVKFKESEVWAWQGEQGMRSLLAPDGKRWVFNIADCSLEARNSETPLFQNEIDYICNSVQSGAYFSSLKSGVKSQRYFGIPALIYLVSFLIFLFRAMQSCTAARRAYLVLHPCRCKK